MGKQTEAQAVKREYHDQKTAQVASFVDGLKAHGTKSGTFDSAAAIDFVTEATNRTGYVPEKLQIVLDEAGEHKGIILDSINRGIAAYETAHGCNVPADVVEQAIHLAYATTVDVRKKISLDSASSLHQDNLSLQPNRAVVAIIPAISEAIPFAHYLPTDIGSNEAKLAIMSHIAKDTYGSYLSGGSMDGITSGNRYASAKRVHKCAVDGAGAFTGKITVKQTDEITCDAAAAVPPLLRGRSIVKVNGVPVAREVSQSGTGNSAISGSVTIGSTTYLIAGSINTDTGVIAGTTTPAIPNTTPIVVEAVIDYERNPALVPSIITNVDVYSLYASPWRVNTFASIDGRTQMSNELNLDPYSESVITIQAQYANERHYNVIYDAKQLATQNTVAYNFEWSTRSAQMNRSTIWLDFALPLGVASQNMAINTMNHGITHLYVGKNIAAQWAALPPELFQPSGISERPGIYRVGRLFGKYEVYYTPKGVTEAADGSTAEILCIGRATDVTRNPFVLGDAYSPVVMPLAVGADLNQGAGFYARNFTEVNPHIPSALGCALITLTGLK